MVLLALPALFQVETLVGVGSFLTVYLGREFPDFSALSGGIGTACLLLGFVLTKTSDSGDKLDNHLHK